MRIKSQEVRIFFGAQSQGLKYSPILGAKYMSKDCFSWIICTTGRCCGCCRHRGLLEFDLHLITLLLILGEIH